jgi:NAD(P)H-dependent FMN reductase
VTTTATPGTPATVPAGTSSPQRLRVAVVIGSVREGRFGPTAASWFAERARRRPELDVDVIDLVDVELPMSMAGRDVDLTTRLAAADAFVVVTPEYNHSYPAALKNVIDHHSSPFHAKPVGFVSYGGISGGLRAVEHLRLVFAELHATTLRDSVAFAAYWEQFGPDGTPGEAGDRSADVLLDQLTWWARALHTARASTPYVVA